MQKIFLILALAVVFLASCSNTNDGKSNDSAVTSSIHSNADSLIQFVRCQTNFGARVPNSAAHDSCINYIAGVFERYGADVTLQKADLPAHDGAVLHSTNIVASFNPQSNSRVFIAAHYDSRPWCDEELLKENASQPVMGANDGASGVAVMMELARLIYNDTTFSAGVDFICFDSEDYGVPSAEDSYCLGSQYWAKQTRVNGYRANYGILLDMVGDKNAKFYRDKVSDYYAKSIVDLVWSKAAEAGYSSLFVNAEGGGITDDHYYVNAISGIPCIDIIDYVPGRGFPDTWHTTHDVAENISKEMLSAVCNVVVGVIMQK